MQPVEEETATVEAADPHRTPQVKHALRLARKLAAAGRWRKLLLTLPDIEAGGDHPDLLIERVRAAIELGDKSQIAIFTNASLSIENPKIRIKFASLLASGNEPLHAWTLLESVSAVDIDGRFLKVARRIVNSTEDEALHKAVYGVIGSDIRVVAGAPTPVEHRFPGDVGPPGPSTGNLNIVRLPGVSAGIEKKVHALWATFDETLLGDPIPYIREYNDVFVNKFGQIWSPAGYFVSSADRPMPKPISSDDVPHVKSAFSCVRGSKGYFTWLINYIPALSWCLSPETPKCTILMRKELHDLTASTLAPLGIGEDEIVAMTGTVFCERLYVGTPAMSALGRTNAYADSYGRLKHCAALQNRGDTPKRLYISRRDSLRRSMTNEAEFEARIAERGFTPVVLSQLGLLEKINLFQNAEVVIGAHGAGLSHLVFAKPGLRVVEMMPATMNQFLHMNARVCFSSLSRVYGHRHTVVLHPMNPATSAWSSDADRIADLV
ncbi:hypothetical protein AIGOOFII_3807 [Methylobacterium marchantiae]|nr:hypothetical protein AIGOOFII_3807 [Methylobacterium marchantiae]